jgi:hypothetical protein
MISFTLFLNKILVSVLLILSIERHCQYIYFLLYFLLFFLSYFLVKYFYVVFIVY